MMTMKKKTHIRPKKNQNGFKYSSYEVFGQLS